MRPIERLVTTRAPRAVILIRVLVGSVFLSEGLQKFVFPALRGAGRFERIGLPSAEVLGPFVGTVEVLFGALILLGLLTRLAVIPLIIVMLVAITTTKLVSIPTDGFWAVAHAARTDWSILLSSLFLLVVGAGPWSADALLAGRTRSVRR